MQIYISFTAKMLEAILAGRKTMTRRVVQPQPDACGLSKLVNGPWQDSSGTPYRCPYGQPGDILLVKEAAWVWCHKKPNGVTTTGRPKFAYEPVGQHVLYAADHPAKPTTPVDDNPDHCWRFKIPRFLPGWAVRITLEVASVRVERLLAISEEDAVAEGIERLPSGRGYFDPRMSHAVVRLGHYFSRATHAFRELWDDLNAGRGFGWDANPWVWVISFKVRR